MIKSGLFVCAIFILVQNGNSSEDQFGSFWGPCPAPPTKPSSYVSLDKIVGKWYTHRVLGKYSPRKYLECQRDTIIYNEDYGNLTSKFILPGIQQQVELDGKVFPMKNTGNFDFSYDLGGWYFSKETAFLQFYKSGAALIWNCLDLAFVHVESIAVMTRYRDPNDPRISSYTFKSMNKTLTAAGISPTWFEPIVQKTCDLVLRK